MAGIEYSGKVEFFHPAWAKDYGHRDHVLPGGANIDATAFTAESPVIVTLNNAGIGTPYPVGTTILTVLALSGRVPAGARLEFPGGKVVTVTADAAAAATSITVSPTMYALVDDSSATFYGTGKVFIRDGTIVGRTFAEEAANLPFGPAADTDETVRLLYHTVDDARRNNDADIYRPGGLVDINHLASWATASATIQTKLRAVYDVMRGID